MGVTGRQAVGEGVNRLLHSIVWLQKTCPSLTLGTTGGRGRRWWRWRATWKGMSHLTWKEFAFVQSGLGWTALVFLCAHDMFYGWPYMNGPSCGIPSSFQYALYIPFLTILMKLPMVLPPLSTHLARIRAGYVRAAKQEEAV